MHFCDTSQDTFYKPPTRRGGQGTKPALSFQKGIEFFLFFFSLQKVKEIKNKKLKIYPQWVYFLQGGILIDRHIQYRDIQSSLLSPGATSLNTCTIHRISYFLTSCFHGGLEAARPEVNLPVGERGLSPRGTRTEETRVKCSSPRDWHVSPEILGGAGPRTKYVFGVCVQQVHGLQPRGLQDPRGGSRDVKGTS